MSEAKQALATQTVAAILRKAGHKAGKRHTTRVKGWHDYTPGFSLRRSDGGSVTVGHMADRFTPSEQDETYLANYRAALTGAGLVVTREGRSWLEVAKPDGGKIKAAGKAAG